MKRLVALPFLVAALAASPAAAQTATDGQTEAGLAREIVDTIMPPGRRTEMAMTMARALADQMRDAVVAQFNDAGLRQIVDAHLAKSIENAAPLYEQHMPRIADAMMQAYMREFSAAELQEIRAFAATPAGAHYLSRSSALVSDPDVAAANSALMADAQRNAQVQNLVLRDAVRDYVAKHPEVARKITQQRAPAP